MQKCILFITIFLLFIFASPAAPAVAEDIDGISFPYDFSDEGVELELNAVGRKKVLIVNVFVAGLYLGKGVSPDDALKDVPKRIDISYYYSVPGQRIARLTRKSMRKNLGEKDFDAVKEKVDVMDTYFYDLKPGDHYSLTYIPGVGTKFHYNNELIGVIQGSAFAKGLFAVWIGDRPFDENLKNTLLGKAEI